MAQPFGTGSSAALLGPWRPMLGAAMTATIVLLWGAPNADGRVVPGSLANSTDLTFSAGPAGVTFDTPEQILARVLRIKERAVVTRTMPPANKTNITEAERALLGRWIAQGATGR